MEEKSLRIRQEWYLHGLISRLPSFDSRIRNQNMEGERWEVPGAGC